MGGLTGVAGGTITTVIEQESECIATPWTRQQSSQLAMTPETIAALVTQDENQHLEFKSVLNLDNKEGTGKFLKSILALANTVTDSAYMIIGVQDKTKAILGLQQKLTAEQLQQTVGEYCKPPIVFNYREYEIKGKLLGVIRVFPGHKPHTLKRRYGFKNSDSGKEQELLERQVFVRRDSIIQEATLEEVLDLAQQENEHNERVVAELATANESLAYISETLHRDSQIRTANPDRLLEGTLVGILTGITTNSLLVIGWPYAVWVAVALGILISVVAASVGLIHYGITRVLLTGSLIGVVAGVFAGNALYLANGLAWGAVVVGGIAGGIGGLLVSALLNYVEEKTRG